MNNFALLQIIQKMKNSTSRGEACHIKLTSQRMWQPVLVKHEMVENNICSALSIKMSMWSTG